MTKTAALRILAPVILACLFASCGQRPPAGNVSAAELPVVATVAAVRTDLSRDLTLTGELLPFQEVEVMAKVAGYVQRIYVDVGDVVRQGQVLAELEIPEMKDDVARASAAVERSRADLERARKEFDRAEKAREITRLTYTRISSVFQSQPGLVAQQEVDDAQSKDQLAEAQVATARSALDAAREQIKVGEADRGKAQTLLQYARVTAPFDGVITKRYANNGAMVQAGVASQSQAMPVVRLSQNHLLRLVLAIPESVAGTIKPGAQVMVRVPSLNKEFPGKVSRSSERVSTATRTMHTEVDVANPTRQLIAGMFAEVTLRVEHRADTLAVPLTVVEGEGDQRTVVTVNRQGLVEIKRVKTGVESPRLVEITEGLREGELLVLGARGQLKAGQSVRTKRVDAGTGGG